MASLPKVESRGRMQPQRLVSDVLLEIMSWLAFYDWLDLTSDDAEISKATMEKNERRPGYSLIRASHVCKYWETVARSNRSLWSYIPLRETANRPANLIDREFGFRVQRSIGLSTVRFLFICSRRVIDTIAAPSCLVHRISGARNERKQRFTCKGGSRRFTRVTFAR
jgi:hypothetical protein